MMEPAHMQFPECGEVARIHQLPCVHRTPEGGDPIPRIRIWDVPNRWQLQQLRRDVQVSLGIRIDGKMLRTTQAMETLKIMTIEFRM
jgi:hypothetical protein